VLPFNVLGMLKPQDESKPAQPGGCLQCHIGDGQVKGIFGDSVADGTLTLDQIPQSAKQGIDCLICHAGIDESAPKFGAPGDVSAYQARLLYDFAQRKPVKLGDDDPDKALYPAGFKMQQDRSLTTAKSVGGKPEFANCFYPCHGYSGGGYSNKKGERFEPHVDVHAAAGLDCVDCHQVQDHRFPGGTTADIFVSDDWDKVIECAECHGENPHASRMIDLHTERVDCTTCHITELKAGIKTRDWTAEPVLMANGLYGPPTTKVPSETPSYFWWDNKTHTMRPQNVQDEMRAAETAKIYAFKGSSFTVPFNETDHTPVWFKAGKFSVSGDRQAAYQQGMDEAAAKGLRAPWDGIWEAETEHVFYQVTHMVKAEAWGCNDCHTADSQVLDWEALGYSAAQIEELTTPR
jgi:hypothetical protein